MGVHWKCDKEDDCGDGSDERNCSCPSNKFQCTDGGCINPSEVCNGKADCKDGSDEKNTSCSKPISGCKADQFMCHDNKTCIAMKQVCDKELDCPSGEDEKSCRVNNCKDASLNDCSQLCIDLQLGYKCACLKGYRLAADEKSCVDIDECKENKLGQCSYRCVNTIGSFKCLCADGFVWESITKSCKVAGRFPAPKLLFSSRSQIRTISLDKKQYDVIQQGRRNVLSLDVFYKDSLYFWIESSPSKILLAKIGQDSNSRQLVISGVKNPYSLAVDWVARNVYFTDSTLHTIFVCRPGQKYFKTVLLDHKYHPMALAVYPQGGWLYYTVVTGMPSISRVGMDGSNRSKVVTSDIGKPNGIAVDYLSKKIYWTDSQLRRIEVANLDGSGRRTLRNKLRTPFALSVFGESVYFTQLGHLTEINKMTGAINRVIIKSRNIATSIKVCPTF